MITVVNMRRTMYLSCLFHNVLVNHLQLLTFLRLLADFRCLARLLFRESVTGCGVLVDAPSSLACCAVPLISASAFSVEQSAASCINMIMQVRNHFAFLVF